MTGGASVEGHERVRLFCALTLPGDVLDALERWQQDDLRGDVRALRRDQLHLTLAFLGHRPTADLGPVSDALGEAVATAPAPIVFSPSRYRETRSVGMLVLDDEGGRAGELASGLHERLERLGVYEREARAWLPHVTVLRFRRPPRLGPRLPELQPFSPSGAAVYHSLLRPGGAQYEVLHSVALGG